MTTLTKRPAPPEGYYLQLYRGAIRGRDAAEKRDVLSRYCDRIASLGMPGVVFHGFPEELSTAWDGLARLAQNRGLVALASWGLDSKGLTAARKGELVGSVLAQESCAAGLLDAEGQWDSDTGPADDMDEAGALALCNAIQSVAPTAWVGDQPWPCVDSHGSVRRSAKPLDAGGVFAGFPIDEFAVSVNWYRFRQCYANQAGFKRQWGTSRWEKFSAWMERDWRTVKPAMQAAGLDRPLGVTLQAYGWDDVPSDLVNAILAETCAGRPVIFWCDPFPEPLVILAIRFATWCKREGIATVGADPVAVARAAQEALNRAGGQLSVDGLIGNASLAAWESLTRP